MSKIIDRIEQWLEDQGLGFTVRAETFIIDGDGPKPFKYIPNFIILGRRFHNKVLVVEPITSFVPQGGLKRIQAFRRQFNRKYHIVVVTKKRMMDQIPENAYDQLVVYEQLDKIKIKLR
jgi:hypothetical protein